MTLEELKEFGIKKSNLINYLPINPEIVEDSKIETHYLGYYIKWHPQGAYYYAIENSNFKSAPERSVGSYSTYNSIDDKIDDFHFHTYFIKFGLGRASYDASQEIRSGDITREEGVALVNRYDGEYPKRFEKDVFDYLSFNKSKHSKIAKLFESPIFDSKYYNLLVDNFRSPNLWQYSENKWILRTKLSNTSVHEKNNKWAN